MKAYKFAAILVLAMAASLWSYGTGRADSPQSNAAHACIQGPQIDHYQVIGVQDASQVQLDFRGLPHGADTFGPYIIAQTHGECESFAAVNDKTPPKNSQPSESLTINFTKIDVEYQPQ